MERKRLISGDFNSGLASFSGASPVGVGGEAGADGILDDWTGALEARLRLSASPMTSAISRVLSSATTADVFNAIGNKRKHNVQCS